MAGVLFLARHLARSEVSGPPLHHRPVLPAGPAADYLFANAVYVYLFRRMAVDINYNTPEVYIAPRKAVGEAPSFDDVGCCKLGLRGRPRPFGIPPNPSPGALREQVYPFRFREMASSATSPDCPTPGDCGRGGVSESLPGGRSHRASLRRALRPDSPRRVPVSRIFPRPAPPPMPSRSAAPAIFGALFIFGYLARRPRNSRRGLSVATSFRDRAN